MEISSISSSTSKLLEALEKLSSSEGSGLRSDGPGGEPPKELVREFEALLEAKPDTVNSTDAIQQQDTMSVQNLPDEQSIAAPQDASLDIDTIKAPTQEDFAFSFDKNPHEALQFPEANGINSESISNADAAPHSEMPHGHELQNDMTLQGSESAQSTGNAPEAKSSEDKPQEKDILQELSELVEKSSDGSMNHADLYRIQYIIGMLKAESTAGQKFSQGLSKGFESVLKQQG